MNLIKRDFIGSIEKFYFGFIHRLSLIKEIKNNSNKIDVLANISLVAPMTKLAEPEFTLINILLQSRLSLLYITEIYPLYNYSPIKKEFVILELDSAIQKNTANLLTENNDSEGLTTHTNSSMDNTALAIAPCIESQSISEGTAIAMKGTIINENIPYQLINSMINDANIPQEEEMQQFKIPLRISVSTNDNYEYAHISTPVEAYRGGFGIIYKYVCVETGVFYALKHSKKLNETQKLSMTKEIEILTLIGYHSHIIHIQHICFDQNVPLLLMPWAEYGSLRSWMTCPNVLLTLNSTKTMKYESNDFLLMVLDVLSQTVLALDYSHQRGVIHGDLKPDNILIHEIIMIDNIQYLYIKYD